ncbi:uncharacterized protein isoform X2 [Danio rerio]|uniref:Uncharacterized protein isoform X2 n=1 Tax=Danio rerio TaxID=7955 RepID=A0AC58JNY5_DANRE
MHSMDSVGVNIIETGTLGRPFRLGMLYDCRKDSFVPGITLWDKDQLQHSICTYPQIKTDFSVTASDTIEEKCQLLNIGDFQKLSFLSGLINVSGAAKYLSDTKKSFKQRRLTLHYRSTTHYEELTINHLVSKNIAHHEVFDNDAATHVVTAVLYGADACFVFDREASLDEDKSTVDEDLKAAFDKLNGISVSAKIDLSLDDNQKTAFEKFSCTFFGDFQLGSNPTSFEEALRAIADLPKLLGETKFAVPLRVWLYPLDKLNSYSAKLQQEISIDLIRNVESVFESLRTTEMKCSDLLKDTPSLAFAGFHDKIMIMKQNCCNYKLSLMKKLGSLFPKIRSDTEKETALIDLLLDHEKCPFRGNDLEKWVKEKENEFVIMKSLLRQLTDLGATVEENLENILMDLNVENVVSYTFTSLECPDVLLTKQQAFLNPSTIENNSEDASVLSKKSGFTSDIKTTMRSNLIIFKNLMESKICKPAKYIVASKEIPNPGSCILIYENGSDEAACFTPPIKPAHPVTEQIIWENVVLKVTPVCPATEELKLLYKTKTAKDWKSQSVKKSQNTVILTDLRPDTEYEIKFAAVGKLNYTVDSDVIHLRVIKKELIDATESILEKLSLIEDKCSKLMEDKSAVTFRAIHNKLKDMRRHCQIYKQDLENKIKSTMQSVQACEKDISALTDLLQAHHESPFNESDLIEWIKVNETESNAVEKILQQLLDSGTEVNNSLDEYLFDVSVENVVCYTFTSLDLPDDLLSDQEDFLKPEMMRNSDKNPNAVSETWLTESIRETMKKHLEIFNELKCLYGSRSTTFLITYEDHTNHPGSCILLYENGSDKATCFTPPIKPAHPVIEQISGERVVLKATPVCPATEEFKLLYKTKEEKDWKSQTVKKSRDKIILTDLRPDTEYEMKFAAVGKLNYTVDSDVIHLRVIKKELIDATESILEKLSLIEDKCSKLMEDKSAVTFRAIHNKLEDMKRHCQNYKQDLEIKIKSTMQSVQACEKDISALTDLLQDHHESPFNESDLMEWIRVKETESNAVEKILQQLLDSGTEVNKNLDEYLFDVSVENVVCYTFTSLDLPDDLLSKQEDFLKPEMMRRKTDKKPNAVSETWLTESIRETMKKHLEIFNELKCLYGIRSTTFWITYEDHTNHPGSCILLYENGSDKATCFTPPLKPAHPVIEQISGERVVLKATPVCPATEELKLLYKTTEEDDWKSQRVKKSQDTVFLTDLRPDTEYEMKFAAVGKLNYTIDSDVIHLRVIEKKLIDATESILEKLSLIEDKCSKLMEDKSAATFRAIHKKLEDMRRHCQIYKQDLEIKIKSTMQSVQACEKDISALTDLLQAHHESPFNESDLIEWIRVKETESKAVEKILQQLLDSGTEVNNSLDEYLFDVSVENVVCYTFTSLNLPDDLLSKQEDFLKPEMMRNSDKKPNAVSETWLTGSIRETMKKHLEIFNELKCLYGSRSTTFLITYKDHTNHPGSCILLYENGSDKATCFTPPIKPAHPVIEQISGERVVLKATPVCPATEELKLLYKTKEEDDWKSQTVKKSQDTVILTGLRPDTEYKMKYVALGKLNYTIDSDVIGVTTRVLNETGKYLQVKSGQKLSMTKEPRNNQPMSFDSSEEVKVCTVLAGKTNNCQTHFIASLRARIEHLTEVRLVDESDIVLIFCPIVSRAGTDIDAAIHRCYTNASKLTVLVVLHHTFDPEKTVSDSSKTVNRENLLTVDCLFYEDAGLLQCQRNSDAYDKSVNWLIAQGRKTGLKIYPKKSPDSQSNGRKFWR